MELGPNTLKKKGEAVALRTPWQQEHIHVQYDLACDPEQRAATWPPRLRRNTIRTVTLTKKQGDLLATSKFNGRSKKGQKEKKNTFRGRLRQCFQGCNRFPEQELAGHIPRRSAK